MSSIMDGVAFGHTAEIRPEPTCVVCDRRFEESDRIVPTYLVQDVRGYRVSIGATPRKFAHLDCLTGAGS